jgi:hypothetical protein
VRKQPYPTGWEGRGGDAGSEEAWEHGDPRADAGRGRTESVHDIEAVGANSSALEHGTWKGILKGEGAYQIILLACSVGWSLSVSWHLVTIVSKYQ